MQTCLLTLDAGTTGLKCTLFSTDGTAVSAAVAEYPVNYPKPGWAEQPADLFLTAVRESVHKVMAEAPDVDIAGIGLSGTMNGCIALDASGNALYPNIIHLDTRTIAQVDQISRVIDDKTFYRSSGNRLDPHYTLPKILWLRDNEPNVYSRTRWFVNTKDLIYGFLTGCYGVTDYSDAGLTAALDVSGKIWNTPLLRTLGLDASRMPEILPSHTVKGCLTDRAASLLGLKAGIPVVIGAGDGACATHGAGLYRPGSAYMNIGSSAWIISLSEKPILDIERRIFCYPDMDGIHYDVCGTVQCAASAMDWAVANLLNPDAQAGSDVFAPLEKLAQEAPAGSSGVFFLPTLMGERSPWWDAKARGALIGATLFHTRAHLVRSVYEGIAQELHLCGEVLRENDVLFDRLTLIGGGARSAVWPQMIADIFAVPTRVHTSPRQATSLGAAIAAGVGVGIWKSYADAAAIIRAGNSLTPNPLNTAIYNRHTSVFAALYKQLRDAYHAIADYQEASL